MHKRCKDLLNNKINNIEILKLSTVNIESKNYEIPSNIPDEKLNLNEKDFKNELFDLDLKIIEKQDISKEYQSNKFFDKISNLFFSAEKSGRYLNTDLSKSLYNFVDKFIYQDSDFKKLKDDDSLFSSMIDYIRKDLNIFCKNNQREFINQLDLYNKGKFQSINYNFPLKEKLKQIYFEKIKIKLNELKNNDSFEEIKYIPIIIAGKSRIGKSTLINTFLKEKRAKEDEAQVCTLKPAIYYNEKVCIFKMIDTRGIELYKQYGIENIFNDIKKICKNPNEASDSIWRIFKSLSPKDNIQCIWYCLSEYNLEDLEIEFIKKFKRDQDDKNMMLIFLNLIE